MRVQLSEFFPRLSPRERRGRLRDWTKESIITDPEYINKDITRDLSKLPRDSLLITHDSVRIDKYRLFKSTIIYTINKIPLLFLFLYVSLTKLQRGKTHLARLNQTKQILLLNS